jgi:hypothetical protein
MGVRAPQVPNQRRNMRAAKPKRRHDAQMAAYATRLSGHARRDGFDPLQDFDRFLNKALAFVSEGDTSGRPRSKTHGHTFFDALKAYRHCGRCEIQ